MNTKSSNYCNTSTCDINQTIKELHSNFLINSIEFSSNIKSSIKYNKINIKNLSIHFIDTDMELKIYSHEIRNYFTYIHVCAGKLCTNINNNLLYLEPGKQSALLNYNSICTFSHDTHIRYVVFKFSRLHAQILLSSIIDNCLTAPLLFDNIVSCNDLNIIRYNGIINRFIYLLENDFSLYKQQHLIDSYENLIFTATLTCLKHNYSREINSFKIQKIPKIIKIAEKYIYDNFKNNIKISDLIKITGSSLRSIQIAFKKHRGYTPQFYLMECKLMHAYNLLLTTKKNKSILYIALESGFPSQSYFSYCFRRRFGKKPIDFLNNL